MILQTERDMKEISNSVFAHPATEWDPHKKTHAFFGGRGRKLLPSRMSYKCALQVAATTQATLNDWEDRNRSWTAELAMPVAALTARGEA